MQKKIESRIEFDWKCLRVCRKQALLRPARQKKTLKKSKVSKNYWYSWRNQTKRLKEGPRVTRDWNSKIVAPSALSKKLRTLKNDDRILLMPEISHYGRLNAAHIQSKCICMDMESLNGSNFCESSLKGDLLLSDMKLAGYLKYNSQKI